MNQHPSTYVRPPSCLIRLVISQDPYAGEGYCFSNMDSCETMGSQQPTCSIVIQACYLAATTYYFGVYAPPGTNSGSATSYTIEVALTST